MKPFSLISELFGKSKSKKQDEALYDKLVDRTADPMSALLHVPETDDRKQLSYAVWYTAVDEKRYTVVAPQHSYGDDKKHPHIEFFDGHVPLRKLKAEYADHEIYDGTH